MIEHTTMLTLENGERLAYFHQKSKHNQGLPGVVFLHGYQSDMQGDKALRLQKLCQTHDRTFTRFDFFGHGESSGTIEHGTIGRWCDDASAILAHIATGPQIVVGSSLGGWIALRTALRHTDRVVGLMGIAPAPDFTRYLVKDHLTEKQRTSLQQDGKVVIEEHGFTYIFTRYFLEEAEQHCMLDDNIPLTIPVRLVHGMRDDSVPWQVSLTLTDAIDSSDVRLTLLKDGAHRLSEPSELDLLDNLLLELLRYS